MWRALKGQLHSGRFGGASSAGALSGPPAINPKPRVNPGLSSPGPSGQRHDFSYIRAFGKCPNSSPGTSCLATIVLSLRDKNHSPIPLTFLIEEPLLQQIGCIAELSADEDPTVRILETKKAPS